MLLCKFAFYGIDINEALRELSGANALELRSKASVYYTRFITDIHTEGKSQALRIFDATQLYRVGRMIQEIVSALSTNSRANTLNFLGRH